MIATLVSASAIKRFLIRVEVTFFPSVPANGESFTIILIDIVGGSIGVDFIGVLTSGEQMVSATDEMDRPAIHTISPVLTSLTGIFFIPSNFNNFVNLPLSTILPERFNAWTLSLIFADPCSTLPTKHLPKYGSESKSVASIAKGFELSTSGDGT